MGEEVTAKTRNGADSRFESFTAAERSGLLALSLTRVSSWSEAEDLVQEVLESAWRDWNRISQLNDPAVWVRRMLINRSVSAFRRRGAERRAMARAVRTDDIVHFPEVTGDLVLLLAEVRRLPARQGQVVALRYVADLSLVEIAEVIECSPETARTHLRRARSTLAKRLGMEDHDANDR